MADDAALLSPPPEEASVSPGGGGGSPDNNTALDAETAAPPALMEKLRGYVASACARLLLDENAPDQALTEALRSPGAQAALARFVADARAPVLYLDSYVPTGERASVLCLCCAGFGGRPID